MPRCVPNLQPDNGRGIDIDDALRQERCAYRRLCRGRRKSVLYVAVHKGRLAYALAAEHDDFGFETVGHVGALAVARTIVVSVVMFRRAGCERCRGGCLVLLRAGGCPGDCFGGQRKEVNAEQVSWRAVKSRRRQQKQVSQTATYTLPESEPEPEPIPACSRRLSGTAGEIRRTSAFGR